VNESVSLEGAETTARPKTAGSGLVPFFVLTFTTSWAIEAALLFLPSLRHVFSFFISPLAETGLVKDPPFLICVAAYAPTAWGIYLTRRYSGNAGLRDLFARLVRVRVPVVWLLAALFLAPLCFTLSAGLARLFTGQVPEFSARYLTPKFVLWALVLGGPLNEELGWRGFALPRLLQRRSPLAASLGLGVLWAFWHLPAFFIPGSAQYGGSFAPYVILVVCLAIFMTAAHLGTRGSVLIAVLFHTSADATGGLWHYTRNSPLLPLCFLLPWLVVAAAILICGRASWLTRPSQ
jgi:membrane protease YdiL (CAAX protease family)